MFDHLVFIGYNLLAFVYQNDDAKTLSLSYGSRIRPLSRYRVIALSTCAQRDNATTR